MSDWQERVVEEKEQLEEKMRKLSAFIEHSATFAGLLAVEQRLLRIQLSAMEVYRAVLEERIRGFKNRGGQDAKTICSDDDADRR